MAIPNHYRALMGLRSGRNDPALGALGWGFKKAFRSVAKAVTKPVAAVVRAPVNIVRTAASAAPSIVQNAVRPVTQSSMALVRNPTSIRSWTNFVAAPIKGQINLATGTTNAAVAVAKDAAQPLRTVADATGASALATRAAEATRLDKVGNAVATGAAITSIVANDMIAKSAGLAPLVPSPLPRSAESEQLAEDVAYVEQQEQVAEAMADAADRAAAAGDTQATTVLGERARIAAANAQAGQKAVAASAKAAVAAGNDEASVAAAIALVKARAAAEAKNVITKVATDAKDGTLPPGMSPAATQTVTIQKPGAVGKAMGVGAGALVGTMFLPGIGTVIGAAAGLLFGHKADADGARPALSGLARRRRRQARSGGVGSLGGVQWDPSKQQWRFR